MKLTKEQKEAIEFLAEEATILYSTAIERTGSLETAKDVLCQFFIAVLHGNNKPKWMM